MRGLVIASSLAGFLATGCLLPFSRLDGGSAENDGGVVTLDGGMLDGGTAGDGGAEDAGTTGDAGAPPLHFQVVWSNAAAAVEGNLRTPSGACLRGNDLFVDPPETGKYSVGAFVVGDPGPGSNRASVRVFCKGVQLAELTSDVLGGQGTFWRACTVSWPECTVVGLGSGTTAIAESCGALP